MAIKDVLREELQNSLRLQKRYEEELNKLPKGSLIRKEINGHLYYYIVYRDGGKVKFDYKGKELPKSLLSQYEEDKKLRAKYRQMLAQLKKQIKFLQGSLRGVQVI